MSGSRAPRTSEVFERYALGLARQESLAPDADTGRLKRRKALIEQLLHRGVRGWPERGTFYTRRLPAGCVPCLKGQGSNLCLTTLCNRDCFFCFNPKPRAEGLSVHGQAVAQESDIPAVLEKFAIRSVGLSGGEPLLDPERVLRILALLRKRFGAGLRVDLYTNGSLLTTPLLKGLRQAGLDGMRLNLAANGYKAAPVTLALEEFSDVEVEIPVIPGHEARLRKLVRELDGAGAPTLIVHELFVSAHNLDAMRRRGCQRAAGQAPDKLSWSPVAGSDEAALKLLLYSLVHTKTLSVYYCSTGTQQWIAEEALKRA
jgi:pyruvate formate-lyase activating enzyme-like uncharacterized protein